MLTKKQFEEILQLRGNINYIKQEITKQTEMFFPVEVFGEKLNKRGAKYANKHIVKARITENETRIADICSEAGVKLANLDALIEAINKKDTILKGMKLRENTDAQGTVFTSQATKYISETIALEYDGLLAALFNELLDEIELTISDLGGYDIGPKKEEENEEIL